MTCMIQQSNHFKQHLMEDVCSFLTYSCTVYLCKVYTRIKNEVFNESIQGCGGGSLRFKAKTLQLTKIQLNGVSRK